MTSFPFHPTLTLGVSLDLTPKPSKITLNLLLAVQKVLFMCILYQASSLLALNLTSLPAVNSNLTLFPVVNLAGVIGHSCMTASWLGCFSTGCLTVRIRNGGLFNGMPTVPTHPELMSF